MRNRRSLILLLASFAVLTLLLGSLGFYSKAPENGWLTALYMTVQLFTLNSGGVSGPVPFTLELARWLAPVATLGSSIVAVSALLQGFQTWMGLRTFKGHTIILGGGEKGQTIARDLLQLRCGQGGVVLIEKNESTPQLQELRRAGAIVIIGDASDASILAKARLDKAAHLVCAAGDDRTNLALTMIAARQIPESRAAHPVIIHTHIADVSYRDILQRNKVLDLKSEPQHEIKVFNFFHNRARQILQSSPLECDLDSQLCQNPHLILPSLDRLGLALIVHAAQICHFRDGGKITVHLVGPQSNQDYRKLLRTYPHFEKCAHLITHPIEDQMSFGSNVAAIISDVGSDSFSTVFLGTLDEYEALAEALLIKESLSGCSERFRILLSAQEASHLGEIIREISMESDTPHGSSSHAPWIQLIPEASHSGGSEAVFFENLDTVARKIHATWYQGNSMAIESALVAGDTIKAEELRNKLAYRSWEKLTEEQKDANRYAADHLIVKVRAAGLSHCNPDELVEAWEQLDPAQLDLLSRMEHERWCAQLWLRGWQFHAKRDDTKKLHNDLTAYDTLDQATKDHDIDQVNMTAFYLS